MTKLFCVILVTLLTLLPGAAQARKHIVIHKLPPHASTQPVVPLVVVPPLAVLFDLARRTSCDPAVAVSTGAGDPGFDPAGPATGNFLTPAIYRSQCNPAPTPQRRRM